MALNTAANSPGELLMTRNTSEVAVCCSRDSESSRVRCCSASNSRTFWIAITAWSAERRQQFDLLFGEGTHRFSIKHNHADGRAFTQQRDAQHRMWSLPSRTGAVKVN